MIISHRHQFIFIKTRKTAGTSVEVALASLAGADAVVTPIYPPEDGHRPRNFRSSWPQAFRSVSLDARSAVRSPIQAFGAVRTARRWHFYNHMPAATVRARMDDDTYWNSYFKFCFERNPWDKVASLYWWVAREEANPPDFAKWLETDDSVRSDWPLYSFGTESAVDFVGRYEHLAEDLAACLQRIGIPRSDLVLPRAKAGLRRHTALYTPETINRVREVFHREIEIFGYSCPPELVL